MEKEQWRVIPKFDLYEVSNLGRVKCKERLIRRGNGYMLKKEHVLKFANNGRGYLFVTLHQDGRDQKFYIHRLVASAFIPNPQNKPFINHIDNNPLNNNIENLEWCTHQENVEWMKKQGRNVRTEEWLNHLHKAQRKTYKAVVAKSIETGKCLYFEKIQAVKEKGFYPANVHKCCNGKVIQHKGYLWRYANENDKVNHQQC